MLLPMHWRERSGRTDMAAKSSSESSRCFRGQNTRVAVYVQ